MKLLYLVNLIILFSCCDDSHIFEGEYISFQAETKWTYIFNKNGNYEFSTTGHMGNTYHNGKFKVLDKVVVLFNDIEDPYFENGGLRSYKLNEKCLTTTYGQIYCMLDGDKGMEYIESCYDQKFNDEVKNTIKRSEEYVSTLKRLRLIDENIEIYIENSNVIKVEDKILTVYQAKYYYKKFNRMIDPYNLRFLVDVCNQEIFLGRTDSLQLLKINATNNAPPSTG